MQCREVRDLLDSFLGQELLVETNHDVLHHLSACPDCRSELEVRTRLRTGLQRAFKNAPELQMRPEFAAEVATRLGSARVEPARRTAWGLLALAASLVVAAAAGLYFTVFSGGSASQLSRQAAGDHQNCAVKFRLAERPISLAEAASRYDPAFAELQNNPPDAVTTDAGMLRVVERHSCVFDGVRFGHVVLRLDDHLVSVLMTSDPAAAPPSTAEGQLAWLPRTEGLSMASMRTSAHTIFIVSDLPDESFRQVAASLANPVSRLAALVGNIAPPPGD